MDTARLLRLLTSVVATSACAGIPACTPCPYTEVVRTFTVELDGMTACDLAMNAFGPRELAPSIDPTVCAATCKDTAVNACALDQAYLSAFFAVGTTTDGGGTGGGSNAGCPTMPAKATLTCDVTESHGEYHNGCPVAG